jgi:hypothetical protein
VNRENRELGGQRAGLRTWKLLDDCLMASEDVAGRIDYRPT